MTHTLIMNVSCFSETIAAWNVWKKKQNASLLVSLFALVANHKSASDDLFLKLIYYIMATVLRLTQSIEILEFVSDMRIGSGTKGFSRTEPGYDHFEDTMWVKWDP